MFRINQRVLTEYGAGTVSGFEYIAPNLTLHHPLEFIAGSRVAVCLDCPDNWPGRKYYAHDPYFMENEIIPI